MSDYPRKKETEVGKPMIGTAGTLMRDAIRNILKLDPDQEVFFDNVLRCQPPEGKYGPAELTACKRWTTETLATINCDLVLIAGSLAFEQLLPHVAQQEQLTDRKFNAAKAHGRMFHHAGRDFFVTMSPNHIENHVVKKIIGGEGRTAATKVWYATGGPPQLFIRDLQKLHAILQERATTPC